MTYEEMKDAYSKIPITKPFGGDDYYRDLPLSNMFGPIYSIPVSQGGKRVTTHNLNGLGYLATLGTYLDGYGYQYEWRDMSAIGGYPQGAIVSQIDGNGIKQYVNLEDNNTREPKYEELLTDDTGETNGWKPLFSIKEYSFFPDFESREKIWEYHITPSAPLKFTTIDVSTPGWILMERVIDNWDEVVSSAANHALRNSWYGSYNYIAFSPFKNISSDPLPDAIKINMTEGPDVSRFYPCNNGFTISGSCSSPVSGITVSVYHFTMEE